MKLKLFLLALLTTVLLSACTASKQGAVDDISQRQIQVVATTGMVGDIARNVGGSRLEVHTLMGPGVDPHLYKASESNVRLIGRADIIFYSGLHLEAGMARIFENIHVIGKRAVAVSDLIDRTVLKAPPEFKGAYDPHIWFDVSLWMQAVEPVRLALTELDPGSADLYQANAEAYLKELDALDAYVHQQADRLPKEQRVLITAHDAFNYFGRAYGFEVRGLQGISTATEAGAWDMTSLADFIVERKIPAIFIESSVPKRNVEAVQAAVQARGFKIVIGGELFSDAMGSPGTPEGTYIGMVRHNIDTIVHALGGN